MPYGKQSGVKSHQHYLMEANERIATLEASAAKDKERIAELEAEKQQIYMCVTDLKRQLRELETKLSRYEALQVAAEEEEWRQKKRSWLRA